MMSIRPLQQTAAAILVPREFTALSAAAAERSRSPSQEVYIMFRTAAIGVACLLLLSRVGPLDGVQPVQPKPDPAAEKELEKLQGVWYHISREVGGKEAAGESKD